METFAGHEMEAPSSQFLLGTDPIGRDILSRIIYSAPVALKVGFIAVAIGMSIGGLSGFAASFMGGRSAKVIMRFWDGVFAMPAVLIGITLAAAIGSGLPAIAIAVGIAAAPAMARVAYGSGLQQMGVGYVESANSLGLPPLQIFFGHLLPNALGPVLVQGALFMGVAVMLEASLSFLGVGIQPPTPSWGSMLAESQQHLRTAWWYGVFPGIAIAGLVLCMNMIADAARDALDPKAGNS
jgi:peptide/nickel transport system permease protein